MSANSITQIAKKDSFGSRAARDWKRNKTVYYLALVGVAYYVIFHYMPMGGILMAFQKYKPLKGILGSEWVGLKYFREFFKSAYAWRIIKNTILINFYDLALGFPAPIIFALLLNEVTNAKFKRSVQTISYLPYFISQIVICGIVLDFLSLNGLLNDIIDFFGGERTNFMIFPQYFRTIYVLSGIWQFMGVWCDYIPCCAFGCGCTAV